MVQELTSQAELRRVTASGKLAVIDYTASWCGPCRMAAPQFEAMAQRYPDVIFAKVVEDNSRDLIHSEGIQAFPTFRIYLNGQLLDEVRGANLQAVEASIIKHRASVAPTFSGSGFNLGGGSSAASANEDPRAARLRRLGLPVDDLPPLGQQARPSTTTSEATGGAALPPPPQPMDVANASDRTAADLDKEDAEDEALLAEAMSSMINKAKAEAAGGAGGPVDGSTSGNCNNTTSGAAGRALQMIEPPVDEDMLKQLLEFEFPEIRAKKAILNVGSNLEAAINWITDHQDDPDIDSPIPLVPVLDMASLPGAGPAKKKLTVEELKARIAARRAERAEIEKVDEVAREKLRRESGKNISKTNEELQRLQRQREAAAIKKEKADAKAERERLLAELAKDKAERKARGGYLPGRLDPEGYNPSGLQGAYGAGSGGGELDGCSIAGDSQSGKEGGGSEGTPLEQADKAIGLMKRQRIGDEGGIAIKTLIAYIKNIAENPAEEKFRSINVENKAYKTRIAPVVGGIGLLKAVGFVKKEGEGKWELAADQVDITLLNEVKRKLDNALQAYATGII